jgi:hypothetical protein
LNRTVFCLPVLSPPVAASKPKHQLSQRELFLS